MKLNVTFEQLPARLQTLASQLEDAKHEVARLQREFDQALTEQLNLKPSILPPVDADGLACTINQELPGRKVGAVKILRHATGLGLKEALQTIERNNWRPVPDRPTDPGWRTSY